MKNVQITVDDDTLRRVDHAAKPLGLKRSEVVRRALREWLARRAVEAFEQDWIAALNNLSRSSFVRLDSLQTVSKERFVKYLGGLDRATMVEVGRKAILALGLEEVG